MKKTFLFFAALFAALVSFTLTSCDGNDPEEGVITLKMRNADNGDTGIACKVGDNHVGYISINDANNFVSSNDHIEMADAGAKKLGAVTKVPSSGWTRELAVVPGHTYVIKCKDKYWDYNQDRYVDGETAYYKIYVIDWINGASSGGFIGAEVKYCEWEPND